MSPASDRPGPTRVDSAQIDAPRTGFALWPDADMGLYRVTETRARFRQLTRGSGPVERAAADTDANRFGQMNAGVLGRNSDIDSGDSRRGEASARDRQAGG